ncbi:MAG: branched-chain amino acid ABC transporter permease [Alphaproteobacteria bacterium]|nr:branched-chain amino acid ABC transporter permease [Alphaproteobacteria bacterium]
MSVNGAATDDLPAQMGVHAAARAGARAASLAPSMVLGASYIGFGSYVGAHGLGLDYALFSTVTAWALPGQLAATELYLAGSGLLAVALAVALANMRLAPMTVVMMPVVHVPGRAAWRTYAAAFYVAVTCWAMTMMTAPRLARADRLAWFVGCSLMLWTASLVGTVIGFYAAEFLPKPLTLALVFLNPLYFMLLFLQDLRDRSRIYALVSGAALGIPFHLLTPDWGLLIAGLAGGTLAAILARRGPRSPG